MRWFRKHRKELALLFTTIILGLLILEGVARLIPQDTLFDDNKFIDPVLGWKRMPGSEVYAVEDAVESERTVTVTFEENGFKRWGNTSTNKTKILIIGDSFTEMRYVNNGEEWYAYIEKDLNAELFVYGAGGYGTTQEYLLLDQYVDQIKPDIIILQYFRNDAVNNFYAADRKEYPLSSIIMRPYLEGTTKESIVMRYPAPGDWLRRHSSLASLTCSVYDSIRYSYANRYRELYLQQIYGIRDWERPFSQNPIWEGQWQQARATTINALTLFKERSGNATLIILPVDNRWRSEHEAIFRDANITAVYGPADALDRAQRNEIQVTALNDAHWNSEGNRVVGRYMVQYLRGSVR